MTTVKELIELLSSAKEPVDIPLLHAEDAFSLLGEGDYYLTLFEDLSGSIRNAWDSDKEIISFDKLEGLCVAPSHVTCPDKPHPEKKKVCFKENEDVCCYDKDKQFSLPIEDVGRATWFGEDV